MNLRTLAIALLSTYFSTQATANTIQKLDKDQQEIDKVNAADLEKPTSIEALEIDQNIQRQAESKMTQQVKFRLNSINLQGNETLAKAELIDVIKPYVGKLVTVAELKEIAQRVTLLYHNKGYQTSRCIVPEQQIKNGVVTLKMEENKLNQIKIVGDNSFEYETRLFLRYLNDLSGKIIHAPTLTKRLAKLNFLPSAKIKPRLSNAGFGKTDLILEINEIKATSVISLYNNASRLTGDVRANLGGIFVNPTGRGDYLQYGVSIDPQENRNFSSLTAKYVMPYGIQGGQIQFDYAYMNYRVAPEILNPDTFEANGSGTLMKLQYSQPWDWLGDNAKYGYSAEIKESTNQQIQHTNINVNVPITSLDECPTNQVVENEATGQRICVYDHPDLLAGFKWLDTKEKILAVSAFASKDFRYKLFDQQAYTKTQFKLTKSLEGALGALTQAEINDKFRVKNAQTQQQEFRTLTGPVGNETLMQADFWKIYFDLTHYQQFTPNLNLIVNSHFEYTPEKALPSSYKYGGADSGIWGGNLDLALQYKLTDSFNIQLGYHLETAVNYTSDKDYTDAVQTTVNVKDDNGDDVLVPILDSQGEPTGEFEVATETITVEDGKVQHFSCGIKTVDINSYFTCNVTYPYLQANYKQGNHSFGVNLRTKPEVFESRRRSLTVSYAYKF
ncbi:POTRA domain-containing protein [Catenovulum maritimum]|uniref:Polypeptide-transport-associated ShlB-type domain-containing protein n=1 Tax=Catenovulum maritimum TaxID=1513271 RepID=A0A0J8GXV9_9ALTE|nr:POTRA domain-containing protein [Catenovulum maritimum]KMT66064.1 hypothetical protein XM47_06355 [Catenovulum maritimum]